MRFKKDPIEFFTMHNGKYRAKFNGKYAIGFDTPRMAIDAVVSQLSVQEIANRLYVMYSIKVRMG